MNAVRVILTSVLTDRGPEGRVGWGPCQVWVSLALWSVLPSLPWQASRAPLDVVFSTVDLTGQPLAGDL